MKTQKGNKLNRKVYFSLPEIYSTISKYLLHLSIRNLTNVIKPPLLLLWYVCNIHRHLHKYIHLNYLCINYDGKKWKNKKHNGELREESYHTYYAAWHRWKIWWEHFTTASRTNYVYKNRINYSYIVNWQRLVFKCGICISQWVSIKKSKK